MIFAATDGSLMGLGISRSVPSSPGERSPSDKYNVEIEDSCSISPNSYEAHHPSIQENNNKKEYYGIVNPSSITKP